MIVNECLIDDSFAGMYGGGIYSNNIDKLII